MCRGRLTAWVEVERRAEPLVDHNTAYTAYRVICDSAYKEADSIIVTHNGRLLCYNIIYITSISILLTYVVQFFVQSNRPAG